MFVNKYGCRICHVCCAVPRATTSVNQVTSARHTESALHLGQMIMLVS